MVFLRIMMHFFQKNILPGCQELCLLLFQSQFLFEAKEEKWEGYHGEKHYFDMSFPVLRAGVGMENN